MLINFRGRLGLVLGMSVISCFDLISLIYLIIKYKTWRCIAQKTSEEEIEELTLLEKVKKWCLKSNIHGISNLVQTNHLFIKILYIGVLLTALIYCFDSFVENYKEYASNKISSKFWIKQPDNKTLYPAFSFCSWEQFDEKIFIEKVCFGKSGIKSFTNEEMSYRSYYNYIFCYTLNLNDSDTAFISSNGESEKCKFILNSTKILFSIHKQNEMLEYGHLFPYLHQNEELSVGLSRTSRKRLSIPNSICTNDWVNFNEPIYRFFKIYHPKNLFNKTYEYNPKMCKDFCLFLEISNQCNTSSPEKLYNDNSFFNSCGNDIYLNSIVNENCEKKCADTCDSELYDYNYAINSVKNDRITVNIYYDDDDIVETEDSHMISGINELIASIG